MSKYTGLYNPKVTPQTEEIPGKTQVLNSAGGYVFSVDMWTRLDRLLILGSDSGSYYATPRKLTKENAACVLECAKADPDRTLKAILNVSINGLAAKTEPAVFALALLGTQFPQAYRELSKVCRIGTDLFAFVEISKSLRGMGHSIQKALQRWYLNKPERELAYQLAKYQQRNGWSHRDVLRLCRPTPNTEAQKLAFGWSTGKVDHKTLTLTSTMDQEGDPLIPIRAMESAHHGGNVVDLIRHCGLVRECIPTEALNKQEVWDALLEKMPMRAMIRNLGKMSQIGTVKPLSAGERLVCERLFDPSLLTKSRLHPFHILIALRTYQNGRGLRGSLTWTPSQAVCSALDTAFYSSFKNVLPTGKRILVAVDVSGSMNSPTALGLSSCEIAMAMSMTFLRTEPAVLVMGFADTFRPLHVTSATSLTDAVQKGVMHNFGATNCSLPMLWALQENLDVDAFVVITDSETYAGQIHPIQALVQYRSKKQIPAKLVVMATVANKFSIADPNDAGMLDVVGADANCPKVVADFIRGGSSVQEREDEGE